MRPSLPLSAFLIILTLWVSGSTVLAQDTSADEAVKATIERLFDGMRAADSSMVRSTFHADARLQSVSQRNGETRINSTPIDDFVAAMQGPHDRVYDERLLSVSINIDDGLATAWTPYEFYLGDDMSHCGVNAFHLVSTTDGWMITQITDTRRREGCQG